MTIINPFSQKVISEVKETSEAEILSVIEKSVQCRKKMAGLSSFEKYEALKSVSDQLKTEKRKFAEIIASESGKPFRYALAEAERGAETFLIAAEECKRLPKEYISLDTTPAGKGKEGIIKYFPSGVVAGITPFNFPLNLVAHKVAPALAAGCPIVLKPASSTPLTALALSEIVKKTSLPDGAFSVVVCNRKTGNLLVTDPGISILSFTGSPSVGWKMKEQAGKKKVVLELGGNAGVLIAEDADLTSAISKCLVGGFAYSGQICIHAQRIFVHELLFEKFLEQFIPKVNALKYGDPLKEETEISVMIDEENAIRVENWVNNAISKGATLLCGGKREGNFYSPTVLTNTNTSMEVNSEEVFGPVVIVEKCKSFDDGIEKINDSKFGLQAGVFTNNHSYIQKAFNELEVGGVIINDAPTFRADHMPYGGIKESGLGREGVKYAIRDYMEAKILVMSDETGGKMRNDERNEC